MTCIIKDEGDLAVILMAMPFGKLMQVALGDDDGLSFDAAKDAVESV